MYIEYPTDCGPIADLATYLESILPEQSPNHRLLMAEEIIRTIQQSLPVPGVIVPVAIVIVQRTIDQYLQIPEVATQCQFEGDLHRINAAWTLATRLRDGLLAYEEEIRQLSLSKEEARHRPSQLRLQ